MKTLLMSLAAVAGLAVQAAAGGHHHRGGDCCDDGCSNCGTCGYTKVCRLVCETKKIKVVCYGCECEDFCVPNCSIPGCEHCDDGDCCPDCGCECDSCECKGHKPLCKFRWKEWKPCGCADVRTRKILIKYEVTKEIPSYKWVVEKVPCGACHAGCANGGCADGNCVGAPAGEGGHVAPAPGPTPAPAPQPEPPTARIKRPAAREVIATDALPAAPEPVSFETGAVPAKTKVSFTRR